MNTLNKDELNELVGGDMFSDGGERNVTNDSEIETGPVAKPYNDKSDYQKGMSPTTDRVASRYRQDIPWFAVYSYGGNRDNIAFPNGHSLSETKSTIIKKKTVEEKIEDLVKKTKSSDITDKNFNPSVSKLIDTITDSDLSDEQIEKIKKALENKKNTKNSIKNI